jgi:hypothetical protein
MIELSTSGKPLRSEAFQSTHFAVRLSAVKPPKTVGGFFCFSFLIRVSRPLDREGSKALREGFSNSTGPSGELTNVN